MNDSIRLNVRRRAAVGATQWRVHAPEVVLLVVADVFSCSAWFGYRAQPVPARGFSREAILQYPEGPVDELDGGVVSEVRGAPDSPARRLIAMSSPRRNEQGSRIVAVAPIHRGVDQVFHAGMLRSVSGAPALADLGRDPLLERRHHEEEGIGTFRCALHGRGIVKVGLEEVGPCQMEGCSGLRTGPAREGTHLVTTRLVPHEAPARLRPSHKPARVKRQP